MCTQGKMNILYDVVILPVGINVIIVTKQFLYKKAFLMMFFHILEFSAVLMEVDFVYQFLVWLLNCNIWEIKIFANNFLDFQQLVYTLERKIYCTLYYVCVSWNFEQFRWKLILYINSWSGC